MFAEGPYQDGERHGRWIVSWEDGDLREEGDYLNGKRHGPWTARFFNSVMNQTFIAQGRYLEGRKQGIWVEPLRNGIIHVGPYLNGHRHGTWSTCGTGENRDRVWLEDDYSFGEQGESRDYSWGRLRHRRIECPV